LLAPRESRLLTWFRLKCKVSSGWNEGSQWGKGFWSEKIVLILRLAFVYSIIGPRGWEPSFCSGSTGCQAFGNLSNPVCWISHMLQRWVPCPFIPLRWRWL
jgi:hypothetical protein